MFTKNKMGKNRSWASIFSYFYARATTVYVHCEIKHPSRDLSQINKCHFWSSSEKFVFIKCQVLIDLARSQLLTYSSLQKYAFLIKKNLRAYRYFFYHLSEFQIYWTSLNNSKIVDAWIFGSNFPINFLHDMLIFCISCSWSIGRFGPKYLWNHDIQTVQRCPIWMKFFRMIE